jgi:hypothetical protein
MDEIRRLLPRQFTDWNGQYIFEDDPEQQWHPCRVIDVSSAGAGLELADLEAVEKKGSSLLLSVQLRCEVRNIGPGKEQALRVGVEFTDLTEEERSYLQSLAQLNVAW